MNSKSSKSCQNKTRESECKTVEIEDAFRLDPEQIMLRKFPQHKIGKFKKQNFFLGFKNKIEIKI